MQSRLVRAALLIICASLTAFVPALAQTPQFSFFARHDILAAVPNSTPSLSSLGIADFNGDGIMDMAMADAVGLARVMLGTGHLTYNTTIYDAPGEAEGIVIGDFNNDGHPDFAVATFNAGLGVYINNGDGTFSGPTVYPVGDNLGLATADVDNDGNLDLIGEDFVLLGLGNGQFEVPGPLVRESLRVAGKSRGIAPTATSVIGSTVAVGDLNGDGNIDVVVTGGLIDGPALVYLGNGNGTFHEVRKIGCGLSDGGEAGGGSVAIGDFNHDGIPDLAFAVTGEIAVCLGNGNGTFGAALEIPTPGGFPGQAILAYDLNGDGNIDIAEVSLNRGGGDTALASPLMVLYGNGNGTFQTPVVYQTIFPFGIAEGDLNGDGIPDLVAAGGEETDPLIFAFLGTSTGKFQSSPAFNPGAKQPEAVAVGDFNGDGIPDLAVTGSASTNVGILLGTGKGGFTPAGEFATGPTPIGVVSGDFNGDGKLDLAVVNNGLDNVSILLGNGDGTFGSAVNFGAGQSPLYVVTGDFNGDGKLDLAITNSAGSNVSILLGEGNGTFSGPTNFATGMDPEFIAVGDLNGDGKLDLAVANFAEDTGTGTVSVLFGNGDGTFQPAFTLETTGLESAGIAIADFNGDGKPDIVVSNFDSNSVSVFLANGGGKFQTPIVTSVANGFSSGPWALATGDFNGDGKTDVAVVAYELQDIALLPGLGNGSFGPPTLFGAGALPFAVASVPLVTGKPDGLVAISEESSAVYVLVNTGK